MDLINILLIIVFLCVIVPLVIYILMIDQNDKQEWYENKIKREAEEKKNEKWIKKSFRPRMLKLVKRNYKTITLYSLLILVLAILLWFFLLNSVIKNF